jgi:hypothetical protein
LLKSFEDMTWLEVNELVGEISMVSTTYLLKEYVGSFIIEKFRQGQDFEEFDNEEARDNFDFELLQRECKKMGIKPPLR